MDNEVVIHVRADDDTHSGFAKSRQAANKTASDIEGEFKRSGSRSGTHMGDGIVSELKKKVSAFSSLGEDFGGAASPGVIAGIAAASPVIGSLISGAIIGGAGIGAAGIGVMLASKSPAIQSAGRALGKNLLAGLESDASVFIGPVLKQVNKIGNAFEGERNRIRNIFSNSAGLLDPLTDGAIKGVRGIVEGIDALVARSGPVVRAIGEAFGTVGQSVGKAFEIISGDSGDAASAITVVAKVVGTLIEGVGYLVRGLTELYGIISYLPSKFQDLEKSAFGFLGINEDMTKSVKDAALQTANAALKSADLSDATDGATDSVAKETSALQDLADELKSMTDPLFAVIQGQRDVKQAQDNYNEALKRHGPRSAEAKEALAELGQKAFELNGKVSAAAGGFNGKLTPAMKTALRNAGLTGAQIHALEGELRSAARAADDWSGTYTQTYKVYYKAYGNAAQASGALAKDLDRNAQGKYAHGGIVGAAANGAMSSGLTMVGEYGPELLNLPPGTQVHSNADTQRMTSYGGAGGGQLLVSVDSSKANTLWRAILEGLRLEIRAQGGNVQQVLGVAGR